MSSSLPVFQSQAVSTFSTINNTRNGLVAVFLPPASHQHRDQFAAKTWHKDQTTLEKELRDLETSPNLDDKYRTQQITEHRKAIAQLNAVIR